MLVDPQILAAADMLLHAWRSGELLHALPEHVRPATRKEGYAIQALLERCSSKPLFGWKIAATSKEGQLHIGVDRPLAGRLLAERAVESGASLPFVPNHMRVTEPEFAFRMTKTLPPRPRPYNIEEVQRAAGELHLAIEVPDSRFVDYAMVGAPQLIADNACANWFVLGSSVLGWQALDLATHKVEVEITGKHSHIGKGANVLGDPRIALTWLANELSILGISLLEGQVVTTGTCTKPIPIEAGDSCSADFGTLGRVAVSFD